MEEGNTKCRRSLRRPIESHFSIPSGLDAERNRPMLWEGRAGSSRNRRDSSWSVYSGCRGGGGGMAVVLHSSSEAEEEVRCGVMVLESSERVARSEASAASASRALCVDMRS